MSLTRRKFAALAVTLGFLFASFFATGPANAAAGVNGDCTDMGNHVSGNFMFNQAVELRSFISTSESFGCWAVRRDNDSHFDVRLRIVKYRDGADIISNPTYQNVLSVSGWPSTALGRVDVEVWMYRVGQLDGTTIGWAKVTIPRS